MEVLNNDHSAEAVESQGCYHLCINYTGIRTGGA